MQTIQKNLSEKDSEIVVLRAVTYSRVSTKGQVGKQTKLGSKVIFDEKASLDEQKKKTKEAIESYRGYCPKCRNEIRTAFVEEYCDEGVSGRTYDRDDIQRLIQNGKEKEFDVVFTVYSSRLGRNVTTTTQIRSELRNPGIQIYSLAQPIPIKCPSCYDPLDDDSAAINETFSDLQSQLELSQIRRNYKIGMPKRIRDGKPAGSLAYGLVKRHKVHGKDERGNEILETFYAWDKEKAAIVNRIAQEYLEGIGTWKISQRLNQEGIPSPQGKKWGRSAVLVILKNPAYAGFARFGWKPVKNGKRVIQPKEKWMLEKACYKGIWTEDYFNKIQQEMQKRRKLGGRAVSSDSLLIGLLKCMRCNYSMFTIKSDKIFLNGTPYHFKGYACGTFLHRGMCHHNGIKQAVVDQIVLDEVSKLFNEDTRKMFNEKLRRSKRIDAGKLLLQRKAMVQKMSTEFQRAKEAYLQGVDTLREYVKNKEKYLPIIEGLQGEIAQLEKMVGVSTDRLAWDKAYEEAIKKFQEMPTPEDKSKVKVILSRIIDTIEFEKKPFSVKINFRVL